MHVLNAYTRVCRSTETDPRGHMRGEKGRTDMHCLPMGPVITNVNVYGGYLYIHLCALTSTVSEIFTSCTCSHLRKTNPKRRGSEMPCVLNYHIQAATCRQHPPRSAGEERGGKTVRGEGRAGKELRSARARATKLVILPPYQRTPKQTPDTRGVAAAATAGMDYTAPD